MNSSYRFKTGQRIAAGIKGTVAGKELEEFIRTTKISNFILFAENITGKEQAAALCDEIQQIVKEETGYPALIAIDQEGGMVTRLSRDCVNMPGQMALAAIGDRNKVYEAGRITGEQLRRLGINFNLAPVVDINSNHGNPSIGTRSFGDSPERVADFAKAMMLGLKAGGVLTAAKHFPGHGDTNLDSHLTLPKVTKSLQEICDCELVPYRELIKSGIDAVMMTHILYPALEPEKMPATMSRIIVTNLLKEKLKFNGLVLSDCMEMNAIKDYYGTVNGVISAVKAGVDLVIISHTTSLMIEASNQMTKALADGELLMEEMDASVEKIVSYKKKISSLPPISFDYEKGMSIAKKLLKESITFVQMPKETLPVIGKDSVILGCYPFRVSNVSNETEIEFHFADYLAEKFKANSIHITSDPTSSEIDAYLLKVKKADTIVLGTYNGHLYQGQLKLLKALALLHKPMIVVALRNPYDLSNLPSNVYGIAVYEYTLTSLEVLAEILKDGLKTEARVPVSLN